MNPQPPRQRLCLITPPLDAAGAQLSESELGAALAGGDVAALILRLAPGDERALTNCVKTFASAVQNRDVALIVEGHPELVARSGADGAHLSSIAELTAAIRALKPDRIVGAGGLRSRHDAMLAGEAGADYVMFGEPDARGHRPPFDAVTERLEWWAELFEIPCMGYAASLDEVAPVAKAGADFVTLGDWIWSDAPGAGAAVAAAQACLAELASRSPAISSSRSQSGSPSGFPPDEIPE